MNYTYPPEEYRKQLELCADYRAGKCPGYRRTQWQEGDECMPVRCCREKGINYCGQCPVFPCDDMREFYTQPDSHRQTYERMKALRGPSAERRDAP